MVERQEFLMDLCDIFADRFVQRSENRPHFFILFRMFLSFFAQYADQITQNLILSRRCAFLIARRLAIYKKESEDTLGRYIQNFIWNLFYLECINSIYFLYFFMIFLIFLLNGSGIKEKFQKLDVFFKIFSNKSIKNEEYQYFLFSEVSMRLNYSRIYCSVRNNGQ